MRARTALKSHLVWALWLILFRPCYGAQCAEYRVEDHCDVSRRAWGKRSGPQARTMCASYTTGTILQGMDDALVALNCEWEDAERHHLSLGDNAVDCLDPGEIEAPKKHDYGNPEHELVLNNKHMGTDPRLEAPTTLHHRVFTGDFGALLDTLSALTAPNHIQYLWNALQAIDERVRRQA